MYNSLVLPPHRMNQFYLETIPRDRAALTEKRERLSWIHILHPILIV